MTMHSSQLLATVNKTDETGTFFFKKCLVLTLPFLRLVDFKDSRGNLNGSLSLFLHTTLN